MAASNGSLPRARPSHHYGKVIGPPRIAKPPIGGPPPVTGPIAPPPVPGSLADVMAQLHRILKGTQLRTTQIFIPDTFPPPFATEFEVAGTVATTAIGQSVIAGANIKLPSGYIGVIRTFNISVLTTLTTTTNQQWTIRFNQQPAPGYTNRTFAGRAAQNFERYFDCGLRIPAGAYVDIVENNVDGGTYTVGADITGWYYSIADAMRWLAGQGALIGPV